MTTTVDTPAAGDWCPITRGFWTGGTYARAGELTPGDVIRNGTLAGYRVTGVLPLPATGDLYPARVHVDTAGNSLPLVFTPGAIVERMRPAPRFH